MVHHIPRIETPRMHLTPFSQQHLTPRYVTWLNDPDVVRYSENRHRSHTLESCTAYWRSMTAGGHYFWAIEWAEHEALHIGNLSAYLDPHNGLCELAIMIGESAARGQGLGLEAWQSGMEWLLGEGGVRKVHAGTMAANRAMVGIFERSAMTIECRRPAHYLLEGLPVDLIYAGKRNVTP